MSAHTGGVDPVVDLMQHPDEGLVEWGGGHGAQTGVTVLGGERAGHPRLEARVRGDLVDDRAEQDRLGVVSTWAGT
jgi:hypothetical protein